MHKHDKIETAISGRIQKVQTNGGREGSLYPTRTSKHKKTRSNPPSIDGSVASSREPMRGTLIKKAGKLKTGKKKNDLKISNSDRDEKIFSKSQKNFLYQISTLIPILQVKMAQFQQMTR